MVGIKYLRGIKITLIFVVSDHGVPMEIIRGLILLVKQFYRFKPPVHPCWFVMHSVNRGMGDPNINIFLLNCNHLIHS
jgi:hypothetical protein